MKELITFVLKPLSFLPALAIMYIIYSFSGQTGEESGNLSYEVSVKIVEIGNQVLDKGRILIFCINGDVLVKTHQPFVNAR